MGADALLSGALEAGVDFGGQGRSGVIIAQQAQGLFTLCRIVNGACRQSAGIDAIAVAVPVNFAGGSEIGGKGFHPAHKAGSGEFPWIVGVTRRERLDYVEG